MVVVEVGTVLGGGGWLTKKVVEGDPTRAEGGGAQSRGE
jgi:hypothetical protein